MKAPGHSKASGSVYEFLNTIDSLVFQVIGAIPEFECLFDFSTNR